MCLSGHCYGAYALYKAGIQIVSLTTKMTSQSMVNQSHYMETMVNQSHYMETLPGFLVSTTYAYYAYGLLLMSPACASIVLISQEFTNLWVDSETVPLCHNVLATLEVSSRRFTNKSHFGFLEPGFKTRESSCRVLAKRFSLRV